MMLFVLNTDDSLVAFSEQRDAKGVSVLSQFTGTYLVRSDDEEYGTVGLASQLIDGLNED